jgi:hypothetical protein
MPVLILEASERAAGSWPRYYDSLRSFSPAEATATASPGRGSACGNEPPIALPEPSSSELRSIGHEGLDGRRHGGAYCLRKLA